MKITAADWHQQKPWIDHPDADIPTYLDQVAHPEDYDLKAKLEHWREHGVVIFEKAVNPELLELLERDVAYLIKHASEYDLLVEVAGQQKPIGEVAATILADADRLKFCNIQTISRAAAYLSVTKVVASFLSHIFKDAPCLIQSLLFNRGSQQPIHLDYPYVNVQKHIARMAASWIPLEDIHSDSGPLAYYCGSQYPEKIPFFDWGGGNIIMDGSTQRAPMDFSNYLYSEMKRLGIKPKIFLPKKGDVLIWHAYLAHEGAPIRNPNLTRKSYVTHYCPLNAYPDLHMKPDAVASGHCLQQDGAYVFDFPWDKNSKRLPSWKVLR